MLNYFTDLSMSDLLALALAVDGLMTGLLAILENLFPPPPEARGKRTLWACAFVVLFLVGMVLAIAQLQTAAKERTADAKQAETQRNEAQGEIQTLTKKLNAISSANDGLKQLITQKDDKIAALTTQELDVRRRELELNYDVTVELVYEPGRFVFYNRGKTNISLWGDKLDDSSRGLEPNARIIVPGGSYYILTNRFEPWVRAKYPIESEVRVPLEMYLSDELKRRYIAQFLLFMQLNKGAILAVHTQMIGLIHTDWRKYHLAD